MNNNLITAGVDEVGRGCLAGPVVSAAVILRNNIDQTLDVLSEREKRIIYMYFGIDGSPMTLEQIGEEYSLTKERIRQIKEKSLRKLRSNSDNLFEFVYK